VFVETLQNAVIKPSERVYAPGRVPLTLHPPPNRPQVQKIEAM
jgi:hypothetical protein